MSASASGGGPERLEAVLAGQPLALVLHADHDTARPLLQRVGAGRRVVSWEARSDASAQVVGLPGRGRVAVRALPSVERAGISRCRGLVTSLAGDLGLRPHELEPRHHVLLCFSEGSFGEELLAAGLASAAALPMVGGRVRGLALDGRRLKGGAVVALVNSPAPVTAFQAHPFEGGEERVVVTALDGPRRVRELDGWPATGRFCRLAGIGPEALAGDPAEILSRFPVQLGYAVAGHLVLRPVVGADGDHLLFRDDLELGSVLRVFQRRADAVDAVLGAVGRALAGLPGAGGGGFAVACGGHLRGEAGQRLRAGLQSLGVIACEAERQHFGPVPTCGSLVGVAWGGDG